MKILIIQHENDTPAGSTLEWLQQNQIDYHILMAPQTTSYPSANDFDGVIVLGGSMNADEEAKHPWLMTEKAFIHSCLNSRRKTLGLCLGSQLVAEALGAQVQSMNKWEIGWFDVQIQNESIPAFHFHQYTFNIPESCLRIASSEACSNQGFRYQNHILAFQFHPEVDAEWIQFALKDWNPNLKGAVQTKDEILSDNITKLSLTKKWYFQQLESFFKT